jgi:hypothetical protein
VSGEPQDAGRLSGYWHLIMICLIDRSVCLVGVVGGTDSIITLITCACALGLAIIGYWDEVMMKCVHHPS